MHLSLDSIVPARTVIEHEKNPRPALDNDTSTLYVLDNDA